MGALTKFTDMVIKSDHAGVLTKAILKSDKTGVLTDRIIDEVKHPLLAKGPLYDAASKIVKGYVLHVANNFLTILPLVVVVAGATYILCNMVSNTLAKFSVAGVVAYSVFILL